MSRPGDVVWADGRAWTRVSGMAGKRWWLTRNGTTNQWEPLAELKGHGDFRWLVKDGEEWGRQTIEAWRNRAAELREERDVALADLSHADDALAAALVKVAELERKINDAGQALTTAQEVTNENVELRAKVAKGRKQAQQLCSDILKMEERNMTQRQSILLPALRGLSRGIWL